MTTIPVRPLPVSEVAQQLAPHIAVLAEHFLGLPNAALSTTGRELRWGRKGSLMISVSGKHRWRWADYESGAGGDALDLVAHERGCSLPEAAQWAAAWLGCKPIERHMPAPLAIKTAPEDDAAEAERKAKAKKRALAIWAEARTIIATAGAVYLERIRMIPMDVIEAVAGHALRFHPACPRGSDRLPAMVGLIRDVRTGEPCGVHRTYLRPDGSGKVAEGQDKMALGQLHFGAVMLTPYADVNYGLHLAEGLESTLSIMAMGFRPAWSCLSAGNIAAFPVLPGVDSLRVFGDHDEANGPRNRQAGNDACKALLARWSDAGREVRADLPPQAKQDWNFVWQNHCRNASGRAA